MKDWINLDLAEQVVQIAHAASIEILKIYNTQSIDIQHKSDNSPVTAADLAANAKIIEGLSKLTPKLPIISEETALIAFSDREKMDCYWLIDPIDGTKEFIKRNGEFTINIALIYHNKPVLGVVYVPCNALEGVGTEGVYFAVQGLGSWKMQNVGVLNFIKSKEKIMCNTFDINDLGLRIPVSRSHVSPETWEHLAMFNQPIITPKGSALKLVLLAEGVFDYYARLGPTSEWDTAAAQIIIEEAGGQMLQLETHKPLIYNKKNLLNPDFYSLWQN